MPKMVVITDKFPYGKNTHRRGAEVDVDDRYVELFLRAGKVRWPEGASPNASDLPVEVMNRTSKRELIAEVPDHNAESERLSAWRARRSAAEKIAKAVEDAPVVDEAAKAEVVEEDKTPKSATYQRRDLVAETPETPLVPNKAIPYPKKKLGRPFGKKSQS